MRIAVLVYSIAVMGAPTVLVIIADGFEELEAVAPIDLLRRAGADVTIAGLGEGIHVKGRNGIVIHADTNLSAVVESTFDCVLIPGGPGVSALRGDPRVASRVKKQYESGDWIAAICAAPTILKDAGVLENRRHTAHFTVAAEMPNAQLRDRVVVDGRIITSRGAGTSLDFGFMLVEKLFSRDRALEIEREVSA